MGYLKTLLYSIPNTNERKLIRYSNKRGNNELTSLWNSLKIASIGVLVNGNSCKWICIKKKGQANSLVMSMKLQKHKINVQAPYSQVSEE